MQVYYFAAEVLHKGGAIPMCLSGSKMDLGEKWGTHLDCIWCL